MSKLVIRKKVSLDFLGDDYKDAFITFRSIPVAEYDALLTKVKAVEDESTKATSAILDILKEYYIDGSFPNDEGNLEPLEGKDELDGLDSDSVIECFSKLTGQDIKGATEPGKAVDVDPKSDTESKPGSTPANQPPSKP